MNRCGGSKVGLLGFYFHGEGLLLWYALFLLACLAAVVIAAYAIYRMFRSG